MIEYMVLALVLIFLLLLLPPKTKKRVHPLFDKYIRPFVVVVDDNTLQSRLLRVSVHRICSAYGVPVRVEEPSDKYYYRGPAVWYQGKYLWYTSRTYDPHRFEADLKYALDEFRKFYERWLALHRGAFVVLTSPIYDQFGEDFDTSYLSKHVLAPGEYDISFDGIASNVVGFKFSPYLKEALDRVGVRVLDHSRDLSGYSEFVYVRKPEVREVSV